MNEYFYIARAVDGKSGDRAGYVEATDQQEAEKQVKAKFSYPVNLTVTLEPPDGITERIHKFHPGSSYVLGQLKD